MKKLVCVALLCWFAPIAARAQGSPACYPNHDSAPITFNLVSSRLQQILDCYAKGMVEAAEWFPADGYEEKITGQSGEIFSTWSVSLISPARKLTV